jgi:hypothetical protein
LGLGLVGCDLAIGDRTDDHPNVSGGREIDEGEPDVPDFYGEGGQGRLPVLLVNRLCEAD